MPALEGQFLKEISVRFAGENHLRTQKTHKTKLCAEVPERTPSQRPPFLPAELRTLTCRDFYRSVIGGSQKGGFQKGGFGGCSPGTKTGTRVRSPKPPFWKPPFHFPVTLFGVDKRVVSKRVVSADVPPERKPERGYIRQNHPFTKPPFYLPVR